MVMGLSFEQSRDVWISYGALLKLIAFELSYPKPITSKVEAKP